MAPIPPYTAEIASSMGPACGSPFAFWASEPMSIGSAPAAEENSPKSNTRAPKTIDKTPKTFGIPVWFVGLKGRASGSMPGIVRDRVDLLPPVAQIRPFDVLMKKQEVYFVSLGCPKNRVDS